MKAVKTSEKKPKPVVKKKKVLVSPKNVKTKVVNKVKKLKTKVDNKKVKSLKKVKDKPKKKLNPKEEIKKKIISSILENEELVYIPQISSPLSFIVLARVSKIDMVRYYHGNIFAPPDRLEKVPSCMLHILSIDNYLDEIAENEPHITSYYDDFMKDWTILRDNLFIALHLKDLGCPVHKVSSVSEVDNVIKEILR